MKYISTRGEIAPIDFVTSIMMGLATDGGLILPEDIPDITAQLDTYRQMDYQELALEILALYAGDSISAATLKSILSDSYAAFTHPEITPIVPVAGLHVMELFHGPTLAFKDIALQVLGNLFAHVLRRDQTCLNILGATSGDTGSAAIHGVRGKTGIKIFILHPHQRVSPVQERQMTTVLDDNVHNLAITGSFDDGQAIIKELFNDLDFKRDYMLGAINSVNWARVALQIVYYVYGALKITRERGVEKVRFCVPTGNFGNIFAGYLAMKMGAPISQLILATNQNDILCRFFNTGIYERGVVQPTLSPSMDIQIASNFERYLYYLCNQDNLLLRSLMETFRMTGKINIPANSSSPIQLDTAIMAGRGDDEMTLSTIREFHDEHGYLLDPHSAVGVGVAKQHLAAGDPIVCLATAHPAKFGAAIEQALGRNIAIHPGIEKLADLPTRCVVLPASSAAIRDYLVANC